MWTRLPPFATSHARAPCWPNLSWGHVDKGFWTVTPGFCPVTRPGVGSGEAGTQWTVSSLHHTHEHTHLVSPAHQLCSPCFSQNNSFSPCGSLDRNCSSFPSHKNKVFYDLKDAVGDVARACFFSLTSHSSSFLHAQA